MYLMGLPLTHTQMNPFLSFCLYVAARVFVQYLKSRPKDTQIHTSLQFLLAAMQAFKRKNPLTESFLVQLDVDLESAGLNDSQAVRGKINMPKYPVRGEGCPVSQMGVGENYEPSYTNVGASGEGVGQDCLPMAKNVPTFGESNLPGFAPESTMGFIPGTMNTTTYELPSHVRSPASNPGSSMHQSPQSFNPDMETSPDGSGGVDTLSPHSSSNQSQHNSSSAHTSHTGYTPPSGHHQQQRYPQQQYQDDPGRLTGPSLFDPNDTTFNPHDFEMTTTTNIYPTSSTTATNNNNTTSSSTTNHNANNSAFPLSTDWGDLDSDGGIGAGAGGTGITPGAQQPSTAFTPGAMDTMSEMMGLSDAEFNAMMDTMNFNAAAWQHANASGVTDAM